MGLIDQRIFYIGLDKCREIKFLGSDTEMLCEYYELTSTNELSDHPVGEILIFRGNKGPTTGQQLYWHEGYSNIIANSFVGLSDVWLFECNHSELIKLPILNPIVGLYKEQFEDDYYKELVQ